MCVRNLSKRCNRLNRADLVVCQHDGCEQRIRTNRLRKGLRRNTAQLVHVQISHLAAPPLQRRTGVQHGVMFDLCGDDMPFFGMGRSYAQQCPAVRLATAGGEIDLAPRCTDGAGHLAARHVDRLARIPRKPIAAAGVAVGCGEIRQHRRQHVIPDRRRRRMIQIYHALRLDSAKIHT